MYYIFEVWGTNLINRGTATTLKKAKVIIKKYYEKADEYSHFYVAKKIDKED